MEESKPIKLDIGAGLEPHGEGYTCIDKYVIAPGYINTDIGDLSMFADKSVEEIYSSHTLEHVSKREVIPVLKEWRRVLRPGGLLVIEVPDLAWVCQNWLRRLTDDWHMDAIFGSQDDEGQYHKTGFTVEILQRDLKAAGFRTSNAIWFVWNHEQQSIHMETTK
jgi:predicted SAM-dependent methyltransferase